jgi:DNA-binding MarR family transcriptional regulator
MTELEKRGLVRRDRNSQSDREVMASLTTEGQELFDRLYPAYHDFMEQTFGGRLDREEQEQMTVLLGKLANGKECDCS